MKALKFGPLFSLYLTVCSNGNLSISNMLSNTDVIVSSSCWFVLHWHLVFSSSLSSSSLCHLHFLYSSFPLLFSFYEVSCDVSSLPRLASIYHMFYKLCCLTYLSWEANTDLMEQHHSKKLSFENCFSRGVKMVTEMVIKKNYPC